MMILALALGLALPHAGGQAAEILDGAGTSRGLCVHLGCGREENPGLTADLASGSRLLVHGIAVDDASLHRARRAILERGVSGQASAEKLPLHPLPYLRDLANLVVIEDFDALALCGNGLVAAGRVCDPKADKPGGFLWTVSPEDGKKRVDLPLEAPPAFDGAAVAHGRIYISLENGKVVCLGKAG